MIVANDPGPYRGAGLPVRPDVRPGHGVLGGILTAVEWAAEAELDTALVLACDMPFVPPELVRALVDRATPRRVVVPESEGPRGLEPLCAAYGAECGHAITKALDRGERAVISFFADVEVHRLDLAVVRKIGEPEHMFFNVNRPEERARAERLAAEETGRVEGEDRP